MTEKSMTEDTTIENPDAQVVAALKETGSDITKPHKVEFVFEVDKASVDPLVSALESLGLDIYIYAPAPDTTSGGTAEQVFEVVAHKTMLLDVATLNQLSAQFEAMATQHQASYDGWGAEVVD